MLTEDHTRLLFDLHHVPLRDAKATPFAVLAALNEWVFRTFEREWRIEASDLPLDYIAHGSLDRFDPDPDNPDDPIHYLRKLRLPTSWEGCVRPNDAATWLLSNVFAPHAVNRSTG